MKRLILVDGDIYLYRACLAAEFECHWEGEIWTLSTNLGYAKEVLQDNIETLEYHLDADETLIAFSDTRSFRYDVLPEYKSNRKNARKPTGITMVRDWVHENYRTTWKPTLEADDVLGILATKSAKGWEKVMVSADKDLATIPGKLYKGGEDAEVVERTEAQADYNHMLQTLTGDVTDGYKGCPGIGEKTAKKALDAADGPLWPIVKSKFTKAGLSEEEALKQARVARICRWEDWDEKNQKVIPWTPKSEAQSQSS